MERINGLFALVARRGGLAAMQKHAVAELISGQDAVVAAIELRVPREPFIHNEALASLASDQALSW